MTPFERNVSCVMNMNGCESRYTHPAAKFTILYCHGNAVDIGELRDIHIDMCTQLKVNIVALEYSGFGEATGTGMLLGVSATFEIVL